MNTSIDYIKEVMQDQAFVERICSMTEPEEVQSAFAEKGIDLTLEQINQIAMMATEENDKELTEKELDEVAGGVFWEAVCVIASGIGLAANVMAEVNKNRKEAGKKTIW